MTAVVDDRPTPAELTETELSGADAWWRAANYLTIGQIYVVEHLEGMPEVRVRTLGDRAQPG